MARPLELLLSLGLTFYALTRMTKVSDFMWERGREQRRKQREHMDAVQLRERLLHELAEHQTSPSR